jgi:hypothetical protein
MRCDICGAELAAITTDLPFKVRDAEILRSVDAEIELEVVRYAA